MLEKSVFTNDEIKKTVKIYYNINIQKIEHENRGSANIFYIYDSNNKYVLKEFESRCKEDKILQDAQIVSFLDSKNINVPTYIKTLDNHFYFKYKNRIIILMKFIRGYTKQPNTGTYNQMIECANLHGKIINALEEYERLESVDIEKWYHKKKIILAKEKYNQLIRRLGTHEIEEKIKQDLKYKLKLLDKIEKINFEDMQNMTLKNCHGDFSIMQFIYENENIKAILDFERAKYIPVSWEIIRSYTHIDKKCKDGNIDTKNLLDYVKTVMKYIKLNEYDLKFMPYIYLIRLATSSYGYEEYINNNELTNLLNFGLWRTNMCKSLEENMEEIENKLENEI